jgi:hypothetical protein
MATEDQLRHDLYAAFRNRALLYHRFFETLRAELGETRAAEVMSRAIYALGTEIVRSFARFAPADFTGLRDAFVGFVPDGGRMFAPDVTRRDAGGLDIKLPAVPAEGRLA